MALAHPRHRVPATLAPGRRVAHVLAQSVRKAQGNQRSARAHIPARPHGAGPSPAGRMPRGEPWHGQKPWNRCQQSTPHAGEHEPARVPRRRAGRSAATALRRHERHTRREARHQTPRAFTGSSSGSAHAPRALQTSWARTAAGRPPGECGRTPRACPGSPSWRPRPRISGSRRRAPWRSPAGWRRSARCSRPPCSGCGCPHAQRSPARGGARARTPCTGGARAGPARWGCR
mmetsp:Transcript_2850/g.9323  ORF Transcript_2850/g.9323 Transcript_2850/m.9323 type:complete len:232 (+) Transcript_2850:325-1020(+)